jgi:hypothetical protein
LPLLYAGTPVATPQHATEVAGDQVTVEAPPSQELDGTSYVFTGWSDGGDRARVLTVPDGAQTYTATYEADTDRDGLADAADPCPTDPDPSCTRDTDGGGCAVGGAHPGIGSLAIAGFLLLLRSARSRASDQG